MVCYLSTYCWPRHSNGNRNGVLTAQLTIAVVIQPKSIPLYQIKGKGSASSDHTNIRIVCRLYVVEVDIISFLLSSQIPCCFSIQHGTISLFLPLSAVGMGGWGVWGTRVEKGREVVGWWREGKGDGESGGIKIGGGGGGMKGGINWAGCVGEIAGELFGWVWWWNGDKVLG